MTKHCAIVHHLGMRVNKKSLSYYILEVLEKTVDGYVRLEDFAYNSHTYAKGYERNLSKSALSKALSRLKNQGLVEEVKTSDDLLLKLTFPGKKYLQENFEGKFKWDGKYRVVMFDIPEQKRVIRNLFRRNLKKWGFTIMQKSAWVSKRDVYKKLTEYIKELGIEDWVTVFETTKISNLPKV